jgi:lipoic acid synthetase
MRKPDWLRTAVPSGAGFEATNERLQSYGINTVCSSARCPNLAECWGRGTTTFMILGDTCTRHCRFCAVKTGNPQGAIDETEPQRVAGAVAELGLFYVVLTSVDRDDLQDLGAGAFALTVQAIKELGSGSRGSRGSGSEPEPRNPGTLEPLSGRPSSPLVEVLTPDFGGREELVRQVVDAGPDVFGHNVETVERLSPKVRDPRAEYRRSLDVLAAVKRLAPKITTKSGLMVGLGETNDEVRAAFGDLRSAGCDIVTVGQYLQPARRCLPVERYVTPEDFVALEKDALAMGFKGALCGPLVRSSYHAEEVARRPSAQVVK